MIPEPSQRGILPESGREEDIRIKEQPVHRLRFGAAVRNLVRVQAQCASVLQNKTAAKYPSGQFVELLGFNRLEEPNTNLGFERNFLETQPILQPLATQPFADGSHTKATTTLTV